MKSLPLKYRSRTWLESHRHWTQPFGQVALASLIFLLALVFGPMGWVRSWNAGHRQLTTELQAEHREQILKYALQLNQSKLDWLQGNPQAALSRLKNSHELSRGWEYGFLTAQIQRDQTIGLHPRSDPKDRMDWEPVEEFHGLSEVEAKPQDRPILITSSNGQFLAALRQNGGLDVWNLARKKKIWSWEQSQTGSHEIGAALFAKSVQGSDLLILALNRDSKHIPVGSDFEQEPGLCLVQVIELPQAQIREEWNVDFFVKAMAKRGDGEDFFVTGRNLQKQGYLAIFTHKGQERFRVGLSGEIHDIESLDHGTILATQKKDGELGFWKIGPNDDYQCWLSLASRGKSLASGVSPRRGQGYLTVELLDQGKIQVWNPRTGKQGLNFIVRESGLRDLAFTANGSRLAFGLENGTVQIWETDQGLPLLEFQASRVPIVRLVFSPDSSLLITLDARDQVRVWSQAITN